MLEGAGRDLILLSGLGMLGEWASVSKKGCQQSLKSSVSQVVLILLSGQEENLEREAGINSDIYPKV